MQTVNNWDETALRSALDGCWGLFVNVDSDNPEENWKAGKTPTEFDMIKGILDAAAAAGVHHVVQASLPYASKLTGGKVPIVSFDDKARGAEYLLELASVNGGNKFETGTILNAAWFLENAFDPKYVAAFGGFAKRVDSEGFLTWKTPAMGNNPESVPWLAVADDYGDMVHGVFLDPQRWNGQYLDGVSESAGFADLTSAFQKVTGKKARFIALERGKLDAGGSETKTKEVNGLFDLMQALGGNFFQGRPTEHEPARVLKEAACTATGRRETLMGIENFFRKYAASE